MNPCSLFQSLRCFADTLNCAHGVLSVTQSSPHLGPSPPSQVHACQVPSSTSHCGPQGISLVLNPCSLLPPRGLGSDSAEPLADCKLGPSPPPAPERLPASLSALPPALQLQDSHPPDLGPPWPVAICPPHSGPFSRPLAQSLVQSRVLHLGKRNFQQWQIPWGDIPV